MCVVIFTQFHAFRSIQITFTVQKESHHTHTVHMSGNSFTVAYITQNPASSL